MQGSVIPKDLCGFSVFVRYGHVGIIDSTETPASKLNEVVAEGNAFSSTCCPAPGVPITSRARMQRTIISVDLCCFPRLVRDAEVSAIDFTVPPVSKLDKTVSPCYTMSLTCHL